MGQFLDANVSINSNGVGFPNIPVTPDPVLFGIIGLETQNIPNPVVLLHGSIGLVGDPGDVFSIDIVRGATFSPVNVIHSAEGTVTSNAASTQLVSFEAADIIAPPAPLTVYSVYISGVSTIVRNGPEIFTGMASTN